MGKSNTFDLYFLSVAEGWKEYRQTSHPQASLEMLWTLLLLNNQLENKQLKKTTHIIQTNVLRKIKEIIILVYM